LGERTGLVTGATEGGGQDGGGAKALTGSTPRSIFLPFRLKGKTGWYKESKNQEVQKGEEREASKDLSQTSLINCRMYSREKLDGEGKKGSGISQVDGK